MDSIRARLTELRANRSPIVAQRKRAFKLLSADRLALPGLSVIVDQVTNNNSEKKMKTTTTAKQNLIQYLDEIIACNDCYTAEETENIVTRINKGEWKSLKHFAFFIWNHQEVYLTCTAELFENL